MNQRYSILDVYVNIKLASNIDGCNHFNYGSGVVHLRFDSMLQCIVAVFSFIFLSTRPIAQRKQTNQLWTDTEERKKSRINYSYKARKGLNLRLGNTAKYNEFGNPSNRHQTFGRKCIWPCFNFQWEYSTRRRIATPSHTKKWMKKKFQIYLFIYLCFHFRISMLLSGQLSLVLSLTLCVSLCTNQKKFVSCSKIEIHRPSIDYLEVNRSSDCKITLSRRRRFFFPSETSTKMKIDNSLRHMHKYNISIRFLSSVCSTSRNAIAQLMNNLSVYVQFSTISW